MKVLKNFQFNFIYNIIYKDLQSKKIKQVHTRFPPEPNGYLHIGHAKAICLNFGIAQYYNGKCNLRFDDTNPETGRIEYRESIKNDIKWLGFMWDGNIHYTTDYIEELYNYAIKLINKGLAYVDELSMDDIKKYRGTLKKSGKNSPYRSRSIKENLFQFSKMRDGGFTEGSACLRAKIDMSSHSIVMRDPVLYRIKYATHYRIGNSWCIYPTYDFSHCIADAIEGITHSLCTLEFQENRTLYNWILNNIDITTTHPAQYEFSRLNLAYTITSKRKLNILIKNNIVEGWDDPRMPTISGLRRRGYTAESIKEFCYRIGISKQDSLIKLSFLEACIRSYLNKSAPRIMAVINPIKIIITNLPQEHTENIRVPNHPNSPDMGTRIVIFSKEIFINKNDFSETALHTTLHKLTIGKEIRLRHSYIIKAEYLEKDTFGNLICIYCSYDPSTLNKHPKDGRKITGVIQWVSAYKYINTEFRFYNNLFLHSNLSTVKDFLHHVNPNSIITYKGFSENNEELLSDKKLINLCQIEREGYFTVEKSQKNTKTITPTIIFSRIVTLKTPKL
ncbi:glutamine--tRNA ligase [Candidatus Blochmannia ocreatus (nom. nud.)]|uniref:Glutamine--tRNA ligase n=1 Tax=Candidatus Blochmannia ocreatus (nom. nud.) TaxID=251538 RepID=A0ABY4SWL4_9ENTR|nr:glutamine--tRNA ligase [Candidatus Blochmannia ocreatus]URJ25380.1 glutamine--tRNA ligase [Candidatus Blochmannia ocreatus]